MAYKTRRQTRYGYLRIAGFLPFEAHELSRVPLKVPYMATLIRERYREFLKARKEGASWDAWRKQIMGSYTRHDWQRPTRSGINKNDPWKMLKDSENRYRDKKPEYESPWQKRRAKWKDFLRKIEREYDAIPQIKKRESARLRGARGDRFIE